MTEIVYFQRMATSKDEIKIWLKQSGHDRNWLAEQCGVKKNTVNNWLSTSIDLPAKSLRIIESMMKADAEKLDTLQPSLSHIVIRVNSDDFDAWSRAALAKGQILTDWVIESIREAYNASTQDSVKTTTYPQPPADPPRQERR